MHGENLKPQRTLLPRNRQYVNRTICNSYSQYNINIAIFFKRSCTLDNFLLHSLFVFILRMYQEIRVEIGDEEGKWHAVELITFCQFSFLVWSGEICPNINTNIFPIKCPFHKNCLSNCPHNLSQSVDVCCLQCAVPPHQLLRAVAVLPTDLTHPR